MTPKRCDTCAYWHDLKADFDRWGNPAPSCDPPWSLGGLCRIGPPEMVETNPRGRGRWPLTLADEYCHAHFPRGADKP